MTNGTYQPRLAELTAYDCWQLLGREPGIGRVIWSAPDGPQVVPVNCVVADGAIWFQTDPGSRLGTEGVGGPVVMEFDDIDPAAHSGWSVIVRGPARPVDAGDGGLLEGLVVWPRGEHSLVVSLQADTITGRRIVPHTG